MKKSLLALAVLTAATGVAQAASSVTLYGKVEAAYQSATGDSKGVYQGADGESRVGIKVNEDLGNGMAAFAHLEAKFNADTGASNGDFFGEKSVVGLSFDAAALYDQKEAKVSVDDAETTMTQKSLNIPVNVRYGFGLSSLANVFVFAGPQWGINVGDKNFEWNKSGCYSLKKTNFSVNVGLGVTLLSHLQLSANYNIACGKTADVTWEETGKNIVNGNSKNNSWQIALGYWF